MVVELETKLKTELELNKAQARYRHLYRRKVKWFRILYEFTKNECQDCAKTDCACKDSICAHVETQAQNYGHSFAHTGHRLRFIGARGCVIPPHLRETCTLYLCKKAQEKPDFDRERFSRLKAVSGRIEWSLMLLEERYGLKIRRVVESDRSTFARWGSIPSLPETDSPSPL